MTELKPMAVPDAFSHPVSSAYAQGWNACLARTHTRHAEQGGRKPTEENRRSGWKINVQYLKKIAEIVRANVDEGEDASLEVIEAVLLAIEPLPTPYKPKEEKK